MGSHHPEAPARLAAIQDRLMSAGVWDFLDHHEAPLATPEQLARVHAPSYIEHLENTSPAHGIAHVDPDTAMTPHTLRAALRGAGAVCKAVELVMDGQARNAFCATRPPGHHAESKRAMGFCFFNNVAVGAAWALKLGAQRVAIADFDVHHGNGTEEIFHDNDRVLMVSTFQHPFYPYSGDVPMGPNMVNVPLKRACRSEGFRNAVTEQWIPALDAFKPDLILISAGFDAHIEDDMGSIGLVEDDYAWVTRQLMDVADRHGNGRVVSTLEGGYDLSSLSRSVTAHIKELSGL
ncbi:histone deacetylase family protein [Burkholderiaceae bacterium DAT-1]|nr:histone deacetylase family protein [Burkholderiaceae bacterium DAT-1]